MKLTTTLLAVGVAVSGQVFAQLPNH